MAFLAAYQAALSAGEALAVSRRLYTLETEPVLGQSMCDDERHKIPRIMLWTQEKRILRWPEGHAVDEFGQIEFDFQNLGRSALLDVSVQVILTYSDAEKDLQREQWIKIGNIAAERGAHVRMYFLLGESPQPIIEWNSTAKIKAPGTQELTYSTVGQIRLENVLDKADPKKRSLRMKFLD